MAFVVEDGTGKVDANALATREFCDAYHLEVGTPAAEWANLSTGRRERNIIVATQFIEANNLEFWKGDRLTSTQALSASPRASVYVDGFLLPFNEVPLRLKQATAVLAHRAESQDLLPDQAAPGAITSKSIRLGPMATSVTYANGGVSPQKSFELADALIAPLLETKAQIQVGRFL